ncbi:MAG: DUF58 domain-containing protein, partial [Candidatus Verstraetearchaeota archaeon]|nr:DUF58 domain-containing protein [Candidatus Verstraetearchaeota archaeon]
IVVKARMRSGEMVCEPKNVKVKMIAGEEKSLSLIIYAPVELKLANLPDWIKASTETLEQGVNNVKLTISPRAGKIYKLDYITAVFTDPLKILCEDFRIPLWLEVTAYPRALPLIIEALRMIGKTGYGGEVAGVRKGRGTEYLWSREYQIEDPLSSVDWKASARLEKLIVKDFSEESYKAIGLVYDIRAIGPITSDEISALFLSSVISAAKHGLPITMILKNGLTIISEYNSIDPDTALKIAISYLIKNYIINNWDIYELLEPKTASQVLSIIRELEASGLLETIQLKMNTFNEIFLKLALQESIIYYIGNIVLDSEFVLELSEKARINNSELIVLTPVKPWADLEDLEKAYVMYLSYIKIFEALRKTGSKVMLYEETLRILSNSTTS